MRHKINQYFFDNIDCQEKAYFLGFLFADGAINPKNYNIALCLSSKDIEILEKLKELIFESNYDLKSYYLKDKSYTRMNINSKYMMNSLIKHGCVPKKSLILKFPNIQPNLYNHFIRGYFDGDGSIGEKSKCLTITSTLDMCNSIKEIVKDFVFPQIYKYNNIYRFTIHGRNKVLLFMNWMYLDSNIHLERKFNVYTNIKNKKSKYINDGDVIKFIELHNKGYSYTDISKMYSYTSSGIRKAILRYKKA